MISRQRRYTRIVWLTKLKITAENKKPTTARRLPSGLTAAGRINSTANHHKRYKPPLNNKSLRKVEISSLDFITHNLDEEFRECHSVSSKRVFIGILRETIESSQTIEK